MHRVPKGFEAFKQFILWKPVQRAGGKVDKLPIHPYGMSIDAHDQNQWMDAATAVAWSEQTGYGLGFVFTRNDPFFFIDIDDCLINGAWSDAAVQLCSLFPGAAVEVSQSGAGLHIFGSSDFIDGYRCKSNDKTFDLYQADRFAALGNGYQGDARTVHTQAIYWLAQTYLNRDNAATDAEWTSAPVPEYTGPDDDGELIRKLLHSKSASVFEGRASVQDLWNGNADMLGKAFPHDQGLQLFDHSAADAALCQHLAFWTGKDCARMDRLFRLSGLNRDKWEDRPDYRKSTIMHAVSRCNKVYDKPRPVNGEAVAGKLIEGMQFLSANEQSDHFKNCVYIRDLHKVWVPDGAILKPEQFKATYGGYTFTMDAVNSKTSKNAFEVFTESQAIRFPKAQGTCFRPELPPGQVVIEEGRQLVNTYVPVETVGKAGDASPFLNHLVKLLPDDHDRNILLNYMAACVQYIGKKFYWCPLVQGVEGNGKTMISTAIAYAVGYRYSHFPNANDLGNKFNSWLLNKVFIGIEEIYVQDRLELINALKPMITNLKIELQGKGDNQILADNRANFIMNSNHKDAILKTQNDRRFCVFYTAQQEAEDLVRDGMNGRYFPDLYEWLRNDGYAIVNHYLRNFTIQDELNPATNCHRAPETTSTPEAVTMSLGGIEQEIIEHIEQEKYGFCGGWVSSFALDRLLKERRDDKKIPPRKRRDLLKALGYDWHPGLIDGRVNNPIVAENGKPRLYVHKSNPARLLTGADIIQTYQTAQNIAGWESINNAQ